MREIGGYLGLEAILGSEYYGDLIALNTGRNALLYLLRAKQIEKLYLPFYLCNSVSELCINHNYEIEYYNIDGHFIPIFNKPLTDNEYLYVVNYFGQLTVERILSLKEQFMRIIVDNSQAFFQRPLPGIDTIYSCRKFFGVPDGAYLAAEVPLSKNLKADVSYKRMAHILGRYEGAAADFYEQFRHNEESLKTEPLKIMSRLTHNLLGAIDYEQVCRIRTENYAFLDSKLRGLNKLKPICPEGPFAYPFYVKNGSAIRKDLADEKIYIPLFWPNVLTDTPAGSIEYDFTSNILPLPCDQRYNLEDMKHMLTCIEKAVLGKGDRVWI
ncbi:MAG: hypothetical protein PHD36_10050 [Desulfotomaculaceae bacterium]|nr:hypothetical protein [Desulfotomaculaceae bacterium]